MGGREPRGHLLQFLMGLMERRGPTQGQGSVQKRTARAPGLRIPAPEFPCWAALTAPRGDGTRFTGKDRKAPRMETLLTVSTWAYLFEIHGHRFQFFQNECLKCKHPLFRLILEE